MITKEEKEALAEHFKNRDLYDPSKAPEQQPADFAPRCEDHGGAHVLGMCSGGVAGFDEGGSVPLDAGELGGLDPYSMAPDPVPADGTELPDGAIDAMGSGFPDVSPKRTQDGPKLASLDGIGPYAMNPRGGVAQNDATIPGMDGMASFNTNSPETPLRALDAPIAAPQTQGVRPGRVAPAAVAPPSMPPTAPPPGAGRACPVRWFRSGRTS